MDRMRLGQPAIAEHARKFFASVAIAMLLVPMAGLAADYTFSEGPTTFQWIDGAWNGRHTLSGVYCVTFPRPQSVHAVSDGFLNGNAISFIRAEYKERMNAYIVTSTLPAGRTEADEFVSLLASEQRNASAVGPRYSVATMKTRMGPAIALRLLDLVEESPEGPFPLTRPLLAESDNPLRSMSIHRLFVRGTNRFEVAVLGLSEQASGGGDAKAELERKLATFADDLLASLQECTAKIPLITEEQRNDPNPYLR